MTTPPRFPFRPLFTAAASLAAIALIATGCSSSPAAEQSAPADEGAAYTVEHAMAETEFETVPERIVVLDSPQIDALVALGITPVGAPEIGAGRGFPAYLADELAETEPIGFIAEPDVDAIANLAPDLIIGSKVRHEALYDELSAIAPTVFSEDTGTNWTEQAELTAAAVNRSDAMDELIQGVEDRAAEVGEAVDAEGTTASIVRFRADNFRLYGPGTFSGSLLTDMGFDLGADRDWNEWSMMELSPELYEQIDGDVVFYMSPGGDPNATTQAQITKLWGAQPGVAAGSAFEVEDDTWMVGIGVIGANLVIDQVEDLLG
ncbi:ABC transporter substrate-binding protein [Microbacterium paraoxydans]|uniref:ABC transporter substrate-binding protein n=1 Tax=Microbacterium paraoxydans TaxID=199592 RepID=UPI001CFA294E|nr:iron-siderophore ABC transporter substrate-binding protein [Microbacterium paraoxydans]